MFNVNAQDKKYSFQIDKKELIDPGSIMPIGDNGILIVARPVGSSWNVERIWCLDLNLNVKVEATIKGAHSTYYSNSSGTNLLAISDGNLQKISFLDGSTSEGIIKNFSDAEYPKYAFANDSVICHITTKNGEEVNKKKKVDEKIVMYKINTFTNSCQKINVKLPIMKTDPKRTSFWTYEDYSEEGVYFASVFADKIENGYNIKVRVVKKDYYNATLKAVDLDFDRTNIEKLNYINPYIEREYNGHSFLAESDITSFEYITPRGHCGVKIDTKYDFIYVFGLEQLKSNVRENHMRTIFIKKYDFDGKLIWEYNVEGLNANAGDILNMDVLIRKNQDVRIRTSGIYWDLSSKGEPLTAGATTYLNGKKASFPDNDNSPISKYWHEHKSRDKMYYDCSVGENTDILIEHNDETGLVNVLLFSK